MLPNLIIQQLRHRKNTKNTYSTNQIKVTLICRQTEVISTSPLLACGSVSFNVQMHLA